MGSTISNIYDKIREYGSWENYLNYSQPKIINDNMAKQQPATEEGFTITHKLENGEHQLTIAPQKQSEGYAAVTVTVDETQWNALRYSFITAVNDKMGITKLVYLQ